MEALTILITYVCPLLTNQMFHIIRLTAVKYEFACDKAICETAFTAAQMIGRRDSDYRTNVFFLLYITFTTSIKAKHQNV